MKARAEGQHAPELMGLLSGDKPDGRRDGSRLFGGERRAVKVQLLSEEAGVNIREADG